MTDHNPYWDMLDVVVTVRQVLAADAQRSMKTLKDYVMQGDNRELLNHIVINTASQNPKCPISYNGKVLELPVFRVTKDLREQAASNVLRCHLRM